MVSESPSRPNRIRGEIPVPLEKTTLTPSANPSITRVRTPWWRRVSALVSLGSLIVIGGITLAIAAGATFMLTLLLLEKAAS